MALILKHLQNFSRQNCLLFEHIVLEKKQDQNSLSLTEPVQDFCLFKPQH